MTRAARTCFAGLAPGRGVHGDAGEERAHLHASEPVLRRAEPGPGQRRFRRDHVAAPAGGATAAFVQTDTTTARQLEGGVYGADGYGIAGAASRYRHHTHGLGLVGLVVDVGGIDRRRAGAAGPGAADRVAACWYASNGFVARREPHRRPGAPGRLVSARLGRLGPLAPGGGRRRGHRRGARHPPGRTASRTVNISCGRSVVTSLLRVINTGPQNAVATALLFGAAGAR